MVTMEIGDWITISAVVVALGIGVTSLIQTKRIQKKIYINNRLNEINNWALDICTCGSESGLSIVPGLDRVHQERLLRINWAFKYQAIETRSELIVNIAAKFDNELNLVSAVKDTKKQLNKMVKLLWAFSKCENAEKEKKLAELTTEYEKKLCEHANQLISESIKVQSNQCR